MEIAHTLNHSRRELQLTRGVFDGLTDPAMAAGLGISEHTVHPHSNRLFRKLVVLITDAPPDGFCNSGNWHLECARDSCAPYARQVGIRINAIEVDPQTSEPPGYPQALNEAMEEVYADISCGWHSQVPHDGGDIVRAVFKMIYEPNRCE